MQTADQHRELYRSNVERWADDIRKILQSTGLKDGYEVIGDSAFLTLKTKKRSFDIVLSVVTGEADDSMHLVYLESGLPDTQTRRGRSRYIGNAVSYEKSTGLFLQPDYYPVDQYEAMYKSCWRDLIVIWKYWKLMSRSTINSWIIEYNVLEKLNNTRWLPVGSYTRLKFVATYFANKKNFHNSLFKKEPYFIEFVESVIAASDATDREDHVSLSGILCVRHN